MTLLEKLVDFLEEDKKIPLKHSLLIASGIEDLKTGEKYLKKFHKIFKKYQNFSKSYLGSHYGMFENAKALSVFLTTPIRYTSHKFLFNKVIDARLSINPFIRHGNCLGLTSLYNALAEEQGIVTGVYKKRFLEKKNFFSLSKKEMEYHLLSRVIILGKEYAVENTSQYGFNIILKGLVGKDSNNLLVANTLLSRKGNPKERAKLLNFAKRISKKDSLIYLNSSMNNYCLGQLTFAFEDINKAIEIDPSNPAHFKFRAKLKQEFHDRKGAKKDRKKARELTKIK